MRLSYFSFCSLTTSKRDADNECKRLADILGIEWNTKKTEENGEEGQDN